MSTPSDGTPSAAPPQGRATLAADEAFRQRIEALPFGEQLAEIALQAERRGVESAQPGVVHITVFRDQGQPVRLYLMTNRVWWQLRTPRAYTTEADLEFGQRRSRRGARQG